jgi:hypothetical protein
MQEIADRRDRAVTRGSGDPPHFGKPAGETACPTLPKIGRRQDRLPHKTKHTLTYTRFGILMIFF